MKELRLAGGMECEQSARRNAVTAVSYRQISGIQNEIHTAKIIPRDVLFVKRFASNIQGNNVVLQ